MNLEAALTERIGPLAGKLHTGRSRNDQVATDLRLWLRRGLARPGRGTASASSGRSSASPSARGTRSCPGTRTSSRPSPSSSPTTCSPTSRWPSATAARLADARRRANVSPLGAGALAGAGYPLDREATAVELGFDGVTANSLDAVSDRDFVVEALGAIALGMVHLSPARGGDHLVVEPARSASCAPADAFSTGSSMMPNKKNPDPAELVRGRAARVIGAQAGMLALLKGLPLAYQRDLQEDKAPLFDAVATFEASLDVMAGHDRDAVPWTAAGCVRPPTRGTPRPRPSPTRWSGAASRSESPITSSDGWSRQAEEAGVGLDAVSDEIGP